jgi:hypothetical protein
VARCENITLSTAQWLPGLNGQRCFVGVGCSDDVTVCCLRWTRLDYPSWLGRRLHFPQEQCVALVSSAFLPVYIFDLINAAVQPPMLLQQSNRR